MRKTDRLSYAAQNIMIQKLFEDWPSIEASTIDPSLLQDRIASLNEFGIHIGKESSCILLLVRPRKWTKLPLAPAGFLIQYQKLFDKIFHGMDMPATSYYRDENHFFTILFTPITDDITARISQLFQQIPEQIGTTVQIIYAVAQIPFLHNALNSILHAEAQYTLAHSYDGVHIVHVNQDELSLAATGSENYLQYSRLIREYICGNISIAITRSDIAGYLHLSPDQVSYIIKITENMTVKELVTKLKMEHAKRMLRNTQYTISEIAKKCGYDSFAYFSKVYRNTYHITPSQERRTHDAS